MIKLKDLLNEQKYEGKWAYIRVIILKRKYYAKYKTEQEYEVTTYDGIHEDGKFKKKTFYGGTWNLRLLKKKLKGMGYDNFDIYKEKPHYLGTW